MTQIWVKFNGKARGPYSLDSFMRMQSSGEITDEHEVWSDDMEAWKKLSDIKSQKIHINFKPTAKTVPGFHNLDVYSPKIEASPMQRNIAGPWRRFFARMFDVWFFTLSVCMPLLFFWAYYFPLSYISLIPKNEILLGMCILLAAFIADSIAYSIFGNTPGKALLGVKVRKPDGCKYLAEEYFVRNLSVWWTGLAFGIPLLNFAAMFVQYRKLKNKGFASYDSAKESVVIVEEGSSFKTAIFILGVIALAVINSILASI